MVGDVDAEHERRVGVEVIVNLDAAPRAEAEGARALGAVGFVAPRAGSLTGLSVNLSVAAAGSNVIFGVYKNGTIFNAAAIVTLASATSDVKANTTFAEGTYTFAAGDVITVYHRAGSGWTATTSDASVAVEIVT